MSLKFYLSNVSFKTAVSLLIFYLDKVYIDASNVLVFLNSFDIAFNSPIMSFNI